MNQSSISAVNNNNSNSNLNQQQNTFFVSSDKRNNGNRHDMGQSTINNFGANLFCKIKKENLKINYFY